MSLAALALPLHNETMKRLTALVAFSGSLLLPAVAAACPGMGSGACGLSSMGGYVAAVAIGLLVGVGSVALERRKH